MNREFLELYNRELRILKENAREFAEEFPGVAERLGGLLESNTDPMIAGLLEGSAFLASRVQLKLKHEYEEFTNNLLEQLVPDYLAPTPSATMLQVEPIYADPSLKDGMKINAGAYAEARFVERERRIACKYRLASDITLWPFQIGNAEFLATASSLQGLGIEADPRIQAGLRISLIRRTLARAEDEPNEKQSSKKPDGWFSNCRTEFLNIHITGPESDAIRIYEKIFAGTRNIYIRYLNEFGDPVNLPLPLSCLKQIGFEDGHSLYPSDRRVFTGFDLLREYFTLPAKFLGFRLEGLRQILNRINSNRLDIVFAFDQGDSRLSSIVRPERFSLYAAAAINLFEMPTARVPLKKSEHEHHIVTDRTRHLDFEAHRILKVQAHFTGGNAKTDVYPLYAAPPLETSETDTIYFTVRRLPRRRSAEERRSGQSSRYIGTDMFLSLTNHKDRDDGMTVAELSIRALCSNRHLTEYLPVGIGGADFILEDKTNIKVTCLGSPTLPRDSIVARSHDNGEAINSTSAWRLISMLSLNHLGISRRGAKESAAALRELISLYANLADAAVERRVRGILLVDSKPINRRMRQKNGAGVVRGLEITITLDEKAFEGSGIFLFGAVLDRFLVEYAGINTVIETVIASSERGMLVRWPARFGKRGDI
jgi:type VI secretion system protein ImpG